MLVLYKKEVASAARRCRVLNMQLCNTNNISFQNIQLSGSEKVGDIVSKVLRR